MNSKIENYVDVLFKGIPITKKSKELKEEILSNLNDHYEAHLAEGKSENQSYTAALADLGDIDELLKDLEPDLELKEKIDTYKQKRAKITAISIFLYILGITCLIAFGGLAEVFEYDVEKAGIFGVIIMFILSAIATGLIVYVNMAKPQDVKQYIISNKTNLYTYDGSSKKIRTLAAVMKLYWTLVLVIYLLISFSTGKWGITWIIWIIATLIKNAILLFCDVNEKDLEKFN